MDPTHSRNPSRFARASPTIRHNNGDDRPRCNGQSLPLWNEKNLGERKLRALSDWLDESAEAELVQALRDGDPRASDTLVELLLPQLIRFAQAFGLQEADAYSVAV